MAASSTHLVSLRPGRSYRQQLIERHLPQVRELAERRRGRGLPRADLVQEACLALVAAANDYAPRRHGPFGPYARRHIEQHLGQALARERAARDRRAPARVGATRTG